ncbi:MAG: hotdog fold thioesterase, partial [Syntrophales bacterium]|nr:hotdog fold thioesterase [Syntrophales bacterium]
MDDRLEGWLGIPHGGVAMGAVTEGAALLRAAAGLVDIPYPFTASFRWGGPRLRTGDAVTIRLSPGEGSLEGTVTPLGSQVPYLTAALAFAPSELDTTGEVPLPAVPFSALEGDLTPLPYYRNCFVCGVSRHAPGLRRQFFWLDTPQTGPWAVAPAGLTTADQDSFFLFLDRHGMVHPLALLALLDETLGWGGFMLASQGGGTVRLHYRFYRPIGPAEKIVVFGRGERVRGNTPARMLFWAAGTAAVLGRGGRYEPVVTASGQWMVLPELTEQMRTELRPPAWVPIIFGQGAMPTPG